MSTVCSVMAIDDEAKIAIAKNLLSMPIPKSMVYVIMVSSLYPIYGYDETIRIARGYGRRFSSKVAKRISQKYGEL